MKILSVIIIFTMIMVTNLCHSADSNILNVTATVISKGNCTFRTKTSALNFGSLDPANPVDKSVDTTIIYRCQAQGNNPITFTITDNSGLYKTGSNAPRMRHTTQLTEYISYRLTLNPTSATVPKTIEFPLTITGTVRGVDYQNAAMGNYSDTVVVSIDP